MPSAAPRLGPLPEQDPSSRQQQCSSIASVAVLSRIAESLYWIGRYVERAEDTARLLDVHYHLLLEDRRADEAAVCRALLDAMGADAAAIGAEPNAATVTALLAQDLTFSGSITCSVGAAWENARGAREAMSSELWETLNTTYREVGSRAPARHRSGPARVLRLGARPGGRVQRHRRRDDEPRRRLAVLLGRPQPRARRHDHPAAGARYGDAFGRTGWTTTLRSCSAYEAYLRTYRHAVDASTAVEFLLLDRLFPRSVFHALTTADNSLGELDPRSARAGVDDEARRRLGRVRAELEFLHLDEAMDDLPEAAGAAAARVRRRARRDRPPLLPRDPSHRVERLTMSWRLRVRHTTTYQLLRRRARVVQRGAHLAARHRRASSRSSTASRCTPRPNLFRYRDYWGSRVHCFDLHQPHTELTVVGIVAGRDRGTHAQPRRHRRLGRHRRARA